MSDQNKRAEFIDALRDLREFFISHPDVDVPIDETFNIFLYKKDELKRHARSSSWEKIYGHSFFMLRKVFGPITLEVNINRGEVCRRVVTGTKVIPAQPERTVEEVEWICDEGIL